MNAPAHDLDIHLDHTLPLALVRACPAYAPTPIRRLSHGDATVLVKDETARMRLGSFKALGGVHAVLRLVFEAAGLEPRAEAVEAPAFREAASGLTFVCASAGNHGLSVAAGARIFGARARVHLAETVPERFAERLRAIGTVVVRSGADYEASIAAAIADADATGALHLADGSWPGYVARPRLVMEGYTIMAEELRETFAASGEWPQIVYLQAGVGGLAAALAARIRASWEGAPEIVVVEPDAAPCLAASADAGRPVRVEGPVSSMGRLDCKEPSILAFAILQEAGVRFATVSDAEAETAVAALAGHGIATTPSGAAGFAALMRSPPPTETRALVIASEGAV